MIVTVTPNPVLDRTLTVDEIVMDEMARALEVREDWGGKGFNVSRALKALGAESLAMASPGGRPVQSSRQDSGNLASPLIWSRLSARHARTS